MKKITLLFILIAFNWSLQAQLSPDNTCTNTFDDISGTGTDLVLGDDGEANITIPFSFTLDGVSSTDLVVGDNGGVLFGVTTGSVNTSSTPTAPGFYPFADDLDSDYGAVYWETLGTAPNRRVVVLWNDRPHYSNSASGATFELILHETSNEITFLYQDVDFGNAIYDDGVSAGILVVGANGTYTYSTNTALAGVTCINWTVPSCPDVQSLGSSALTETGATFDWTAGGSETAWEYALLLASDPAPTTGISIGTNTYTDSSLTNSTDYIFYVRADCTGGDYSNWVSTAFTTLTPAPSNDDCANATLVDGALPYNNTLNASGATNNAGFISDCSSGMNDGVWYTFTPITGGTVDIVVTGVTGWDPELAIYSGSCGTFTCVDSADGGGTGGGESLFGVAVVAGTQYFINIGYWSGSTDNSEGPFTIDISTPDTVGLSVEDNIIEGFSLYPNPVNDRLHLNALDNIEELSVYNLLGQEVLRTQPKVSNTQVDMSNLPTGMYVVKVKVGQQLGSYRIVKE